MELWAINDYKENNVLILKKDKKYLIYSEIESDTFLSKKGFIVFSENGKFRGLDSILFEDDIERDLRKFNI